MTTTLLMKLKNILLRERSQIQQKTYGEVLEEAKLTIKTEIKLLKRKSRLRKGMRELSGRCYKCSISQLGCRLHGVDISQTLSLNCIHLFMTHISIKLILKYH